MQKIDRSVWPRAELFRFFSGVSHPFYSVSFRVDVKNISLWNDCTDSTDKVFFADTQCKSCLLLQIRFLICVCRININRHLAAVRICYRFFNIFYQKILIFFRLHICRQFFFDFFKKLLFQTLLGSSKLSLKFQRSL